jgi:two-component system, sensor histidine kinase ChiS
VSATITGSHMEISIRDTGIGLPMESQDKVFLRFEQAHDQSSNEFEGTGLGLPITKHLVELHKGTIRLKSERDRGTTFFFTLPLAIKGQIASKASTSIKSPLKKLEIQFPTTLPEPIQPRMATKGERSMILVVDDDPINLQVAVNHLAPEGYEVLTAQSGEQALKMMPGNKPDLVLLDIMMPQMDGYEVCKTLRETHSMSALPVIMLTARNQIQDMVKGFDTGANDYLTKPFSREELLARVHTQLKLKRAYKVLRENSRLKKEIERRKITERDLKMMQQRLSRILDSLDEAIIAVNECFEICFSNTRCHVMMGYDSKELLGQPAAKLFSLSAGKKDLDTAQFFNGAQSPMEILQKDGSFKPFHVAVSSLEIENETLQLLVIQQTPRDSLVPSPSHEKTIGLAMIEAINRNQQHMEQFENILSANISLPTTGTGGDKKILRQENRDTFSGNSVDLEQEKNLQGVKVMTLTLALWSHETGTTKIDLAEQSGIWKVYMNKDGYERTQTFDKYLSIKKFPTFPRWPKVYMTVDFVLLSCRASERQNALEIEYTHLKNLTLVFG